MENQKMTPQESLDLITEVINDAKNRIENKGSIFIFWGLISSICSISQYFLLKSDLADYNYFPYFLMPIAAIISILLMPKKYRKSNNKINKIIGKSWIIVSLNIMLLGFFFFPFLKEMLIPILLILLGVETLFTGFATKSKILIFSGIIINLAGFFCFYLKWFDQPLFAGIISLLAIFIPGIILTIQAKKKENV